MSDVLVVSFCGPSYADMLGVLEKSVRENTDHKTAFCVHEAFDCQDSQDGFLAKAAAWSSSLTGIPGDGRRVVFLDADMMVLGPLDGAFGDQDVRYTVRPGRTFLNSGALYVTTSPQSRAFMKTWQDKTLDRHKFGQFDKMGTCDQAGLLDAILSLTGSPDGEFVAPLLCDRWNSVDSTWHSITDDTRVVHVKGKARQMARGVMEIDDSPAGRVASIWRSYL